MGTTRGEIRQGVRHYLGERIPGVWQDDEINYFIQESGNEHAKRAYSVKTIIYTSTIQNVRDYAFPPNFGDLLSVRYRDECIRDEWELEYIAKDVLRDTFSVGTDLGDPYYYYREQDSFGLCPVPNKPLVIEHTFENDCPGFTEIFDRETSRGFSQGISLEIVPDETTEPIEMEIRDSDLDPRCVWVEHVSLYLRRSGAHLPGKLWLSFTNLSDEHQFVHTSRELFADSINSFPEWVHFDFTPNPIEVNSTQQIYKMELHVDSDYRAVEPRSYGGSGVLIGVDAADPPYAFFQMHRLRHDLEVEYYRNVCDVMEDDDDVINIPDRYTETIVHMTLEKCYLKNAYNTQLAAYWGAKADAEIKEAKASAVVPTLGRRRELRRSLPRLGNLTYNQRTGLFRLRLGSP